MDYRTWPGLPNAVTREDAPLSKESWIPGLACGDRLGSRFTGSLAPGCPSTRGDRQPGGKDVDGGVLVGVGLVPAGRAIEHRLALAVLGAGMPDTAQRCDV